MENASKALLIGGGILIAMLTISIGVSLFMSYRGAGSSYDRDMQATELQKFNVNFTKFEGRNDITIQEIVTLANFAENYNKENGKNIKVNLVGEGNIVGKDDLIGKLKEKSENKFKYNSMEYLEGFVKSITFKEI